MTRQRWLILLGIAMVVLTIVPIFVFEKRLEHTGGPGILAFEFAATKARATRSSPSGVRRAATPHASP